MGLRKKITAFTTRNPDCSKEELIAFLTEGIIEIGDIVVVHKEGSVLKVGTELLIDRIVEYKARYIYYGMDINTMKFYEVRRPFIKKKTETKSNGL